MHRRDVLEVGASGAIVAMAGCTARATGWSSVRIILRNGLDRALRLDVSVSVNETRAFDRRISLDAKATKEIEAAIDVPWGATLAFRVTRPDSNHNATAEWRASIPLWGGDKCTIEPVVRVDTRGIHLGRACK